jgi:hypothetical protein
MSEYGKLSGRALVSFKPFRLVVTDGWNKYARWYGGAIDRGSNRRWMSSTVTSLTVDDAEQLAHCVPAFAFAPEAFGGHLELPWGQEFAVKTVGAWLEGCLIGRKREEEGSFALGLQRQRIE